MIELTYKAASIFRVEFRDKCKATAKYLSSIFGEKSMKKVDKEEKMVVKGISPNNCVSESGHAVATYDLQVCGTIDLQHCAARDQTESNNNFGQGNELLVHRRKAFKYNITSGMLGFHLLPPELKRTAVITAKWNRKSHRYDFNIAMVDQFKIKCRKEEITLKKKL